MVLTRFILAPDNSSYSVTDGKEVIAVQLDGGAARYRRDILNSTRKVSVQWVTDREGYQYIRSFYRSVTVSGSIPFEIDLVLDMPTLTTHQAHFVPGSMILQSQRGLSYIVGAELEVYPNDESGSEIDYVDLFNEFKGWNKFAKFEDRLDILMNVDWPTVL